MKPLHLFACCSLIIILTGCPCKRCYEYHKKNNSEYNIIVSSLRNKYYPDTTITFKPSGIMKPYSYSIIPISDPLEDIVKSMPQDTLSFFIFHADTVNKYPLEILQWDYKILRRYDLSSQDIITLKNKYGIPEIPYPPDERMKYMKMYPQYGK